MLRVLTLLSLSSSLVCAGCGGGGAADASDSDGAMGGQNVDGSQDFSRKADKIVSFGKPDCETARTVCDADGKVRLCVGGNPGAVVDTCDGVSCSLGRCTTSACTDAEHYEALRGCRFYGVQMDNIDEADAQKLMLLLSNGAPTAITARVDVPARDGTWTNVAKVVVPPDGGTRIELNRPVLDAGLTIGGGFRVGSDGPIMVVQIVGDDADGSARSSSGTVLRPVQSLGREYLAVTSPATVTTAVSDIAGSRNAAASITVIATEANTHVKLALTGVAVAAAGGPLDPLPASYDVPPMNEGDVLQVFSTAPDGDLTGSTITADLPVAAFSGNIFTTYGFTPTGFNGGDQAEEQLPPTATWGTDYAGMRLSPQNGCDSFYSSGVGLWRVIAADSVEVTVTPGLGVSVDGLPASSDASSFHLERGEFQAFRTRANRSPPMPTDLMVHASGPILLAQWLDCEPGLSWGVDTRLSGGDLSFVLPPRFDHQVIVVRDAGRDVALDGILILNSRFRTIVPGSRFEAVRLEAPDLGPCEDALDNCQHHLTGAAFGLTWRGMDVVCSYTLTVPPADGCTLPNAMCTQ